MASALKTALRLLREKPQLTKNGYPNATLHTRISEITGQSRDSLHGTLDGLGPGTLLSDPEYRAHYHKITLPNGRVAHKQGARKPNELVFTCPNKIRTMGRIMKNLGTEPKPRLLTLASTEGNCVRAAMEACPDVRVFNVESDEAVLDDWDRTREGSTLDSEMDYLGKFEDFIATGDYLDHDWALVNADVMGYPGTKMSKWLRSFNHTAKAEVLALTTQHDPDGNFRNQDGWKWDEEYPSGDRKGNFVRDHLPKYEQVDRWNYTKENGQQSMEVFIMRKVA